MYHFIMDIYIAMDPAI